MAHRINILSHLRQLVFFSFHRFQGDNYAKMRQYLANILLIDLEEFTSLSQKRILDVGGANGEFCRFLSERRGCEAVNLDPSPEKPVWKTVIAQAKHMPFDDDSFDIVLFRGVLEHIPYEDQQRSLDEIHRVMKKAGIGYFVIPPWFNPHAGHGLKPFHVLPFKIAKKLREVCFRETLGFHSLEEHALYKITFRQMRRMTRRSGFKIVAARDTHFRMHFLTRVPGLREVLVPAVAFIVRK